MIHNTKFHNPRLHVSRPRSIPRLGFGTGTKTRTSRFKTKTRPTLDKQCTGIAKLVQITRQHLTQHLNLQQSAYNTASAYFVCGTFTVVHFLIINQQCTQKFIFSIMTKTPSFKTKTLKFKTETETKTLKMAY